jgi:protocatechuate 3,4-dioxygenase beta subunit
MLASLCSVTAQEVAPFPPAPDDVSSLATLVGDSEPGEKLVITGTVYQTDRKTPRPGFLLYIYQTDATGMYNRVDGNWQRPRLRGWVKTDRLGRYEIRTIKPGSYPRSNNPAHIHVIVKVGKSDPRWIDDFLFEGDPFLRGSDRELSGTQGTFSPVMRVSRDEQGRLLCRRDIVIP